MGARNLSSGNLLIGIVIGLVLALLSAMWLDRITFLQQADAQIPNPGAQRNNIQRELSNLNAQMDELIRLLKSGQIKVICTQADDKKQE